MDSEQLVQALQAVLEEKKGLAIEQMDLRERATFTDFFLIATGSSSTHVSALAEEVDRFAHQNHIPVLGWEGRSHAPWVLVDMGGVIVHLFLAETRKLYSLDKLWSQDTLLLHRSAMAGDTDQTESPDRSDASWDHGGEEGDDDEAYDDETYDDETYDDETYDDETYDDETYDDEAYDDEAYDDDVYDDDVSSGDDVSDDDVSDDDVSDDDVSDDDASDDKTYDDEASDDEASEEKVTLKASKKEGKGRKF